MALYSLQHNGIAALGGIGKTAARLGYICCNRKDVVLLGERHGLPRYDRPNLRTLAERHEAMAGRNGRIAECFIIALPREGGPDQHRALVRDFAEKVTHGTAPWVAAIHYDRPGNPHVHLIALEQNKPRTGGKGRPSKVIGLSRKGALEVVREEWTETHNRIMAGTGPPIDHRSFEDQGKAHLLPTLHEGPAARAMRARGAHPASSPKPTRGGRIVEWSKIDEGRTRAETNVAVRRVNALATQLQEQGYEPRSDRVFPSPAGERGAVPPEHRAGGLAAAGAPERDGENDRSVLAPVGTDGIRAGDDVVPTVPRTTHPRKVDASPLAENSMDHRAATGSSFGSRLEDSVTRRYSAKALEDREHHFSRLLRDRWDSVRTSVQRMIDNVDWSLLSSSQARRLLHQPPPQQWPEIVPRSTAKPPKGRHWR
ncbi:MobA/MobL family protein [Asaia siamensis]